MKFVLLLFCFAFIGCNGSQDSKGSSSKVSSGEVAEAQAAKVFIQQSNIEISERLRIEHTELDIWVSEGLLTSEEAKSIKENI